MTFLLIIQLIYHIIIRHTTIVLLCMLDAALLRIFGLAAGTAVGRHLRHVRVMRDIKLPTQSLGAEERDNNHVRIHTAHEDANHLAVLVALLALLRWRQREALANSRFNR